MVNGNRLCFLDDLEMKWMNEKSYGVSEINRYIKHLFDSDFALGRIWVRGEISNCKYHSSGHIYFSLKDQGGQISCVMFSSNSRGLGFRLEEGQSVVVQGNITIYERDGKYQLYAKQIRLDGAGLLYEKFLKLKNELEDEGLFAAEYKQPIPKYAEKIGIVTAVTGAAIHDIESIALRRNPYIKLYLYPAKVQGEGAADSIVHGIEILDQMDMDVIIVGRGGGSIEDLWAFNEEKVARAIFKCNTPIVSAVGHEVDFTIADFVADLRAPTPSAAAELTVYEIQKIYEQIEAYQLLLLQKMNQKVKEQRNRCERLRLKLEHGNPTSRLQQKRHRLMDIEERLELLMKKNVQKNRYRIAVYAEQLKGLSPLRKLSQGYSFVADENGKAIKSVKQVKKEQEIFVSVTDGNLTAVVKKIENKKRN